MVLTADRAQRHGLVRIDLINKRALPIALNGRGWNQGGPALRIHQKPGIDELVGEKGTVLILEDGLQLDRVPVVVSI